MRNQLDPFFMLVTVLAILAAAGGIAVAETLTVKAVDAAFVTVGAKASPTERFAAQELQRYARQLCGVEIALAGDMEKREGVVFRVGRQPATMAECGRFDASVTGPGADSFVIKVSTSNKEVLLVGGGDRGTLYSVYELLERQGCRWFMPGRLGEGIPKKESLAIEVIDQLFVPSFIQREIVGTVAEGVTREETIDWAVKNRLNRDFNVRTPLQEWAKRGMFIKWQWIGHNYEWVLPNQKYFKEHPEYYALYKGQRVEVGNEKGNICTTNPDVIRIFVDFVCQWFDANPDGTVFPLSPHDGMIRWCECAECQKLGGINFMPGPKGSMSRRQVTFVNEVARRVAEKYPDRLIQLLAYQNYVDPVPDLKLEPNVLASCVHYGCQAHGLDKCAANQTAKERFKGWAAMANPRVNGPGIWDYFLLQVDKLSGSKLTPMPLEQTARDTIRFLRSLGGRYYLVQAGPMQQHSPLPYYVITRLLWNSDADYDALVADFHEKFYAEACVPMKKYGELLEAAVQKADWHPAVWQEITVPSPKVFTPAVLAEAEKHLSAAEQAATTALVKERIALVRRSFDFAKSTVGQQSAWRLQRGERAYTVNADGIAEDEQRVENLVADQKRSGDPDGMLARLAFRLKKREIPIIQLANDRIAVAVMPGLGGRMIRLVEKRTGTNVLREPAEVTTLKNVSTAYFDYGGYEEYAGAAFAAPGWEQAYETAQKEDSAARSIVMTTSVGDLWLERVVRVPKGDTPEVAIASTLVNRGNLPAKIRLRVHPEMRLAANHDTTQIWLLDQGGKLRKIHVSESLPEQPQGLWAAIDDQSGRGIVNTFDPSQAECLLFFNPQEQFFNLELFGKEKTLGPQESLRIEHRYRLLRDGAKELELLVKSGGNPERK